jgi:hypothetical protein
LKSGQPGWGLLDGGDLAFVLFFFRRLRKGLLTASDSSGAWREKREKREKGKEWRGEEEEEEEEREERYGVQRRSQSMRRRWS